VTIARLRRGEAALPASAVLFAARLAGAVIALATQVMLARLMPPAALGLFFFATSLVAVLSVMAAAGYPQAATRYLTRYHAMGRQRLGAAFARSARRDVAMLAIGFAVVAMAGASMASDGRTAIAVGVAALAVPPLALTLLFGAVANVRRRFLLASLPEFLMRPAGMLLVVAALAWLEIVPSVPALLAAFVVLCLGVTVIQAIGLGRSAFSRAGGTASPTRTRCWRAGAFPLVMLSLFTALFADIAIVAASPFMARGDLAVLAICLKISLLIGFVIQVVHQTVMPAVAEDIHCNRAACAMLRVRDANHVIAVAMLGATVLVALIGDRLLAVFEPTFAAAHHVLVILVASQAVRALAGPASQLLTVVGRQRYIIAACPLALVLLGVSNAVLIPRYGMTGAAVAILLTMSAWSMALSWLLARTTGLRGHYSPLAAWTSTAVIAQASRSARESRS
jgi:O-antigen/teichoic acid export membrane protein